LSPLRKAPITAACILTCTFLFVICAASQPKGMKFRDVQRTWGAAVSLQLFNGHHQQREVVMPELFGPFDLWDGQWWRVPVSAFHHANAAHLILNCAAAWILGKRLESRWGSARYALFLIPAVFIPMVAEFAAGNIAIGFSGAICAIFGAVVALQQFQPRDDDFPIEFIQLNVGLLFLGIPLSMLDLVKIANLAHFSGLAYGWLTVWVWFAPIRQATLVRLGFFASHLAVVPALWWTIHPITNGRYLWYMADHHVVPTERSSMLRLAVETDPSLTAVWLRLAESSVIEGDLLGAWRILAEALSYNPADRELMKAARRVWNAFAFDSERVTAEEELRRVFGERAADWLRQIRQTILDNGSDDAAINARNDPEPDPKQFPLDQPIDLDWHPKAVTNEPPRPVDPDAADSAAEGTSL
jgi:rhomboid protease GluP